MNELSENEKELIRMFREAQEKISDFYFLVKTERKIPVDRSYFEDAKEYIYFDFESVVPIDEAKSFFLEHYMEFFTDENSEPPESEDEKEDYQEEKNEYTKFCEWIEDPYRSSYEFRNETLETIYMVNIPEEKIRILQPEKKYNEEIIKTNNICSLDPFFQRILNLAQKEKKRKENEKNSI